MLGRKLRKKQRAEDINTWGLPEHLDEAQNVALDSLRSLVNESDLEMIKFGIESDTSALCRFLRARKFDVDLSSEMIRECVAMKQQNQVANLVELGLSNCLGCPHEIYETFNPYWYTGFDKEKRVVMVQHCGILDTYLLSCLTNMDSIIKYHWCTMEMLNDQFIKAQDEFGEHCVGITVILDLNGFGPSTATKHAYNYMKALSEIDSLCYPEILAKVFIVNAPRIFSGVWKIIKSWLDPRTTSKFEIFSSMISAKSHILEYIDEDMLPEEYGGNAAGRLKRHSSAEVIRLGMMRRTFTFDVSLDVNKNLSLQFFSNASGILISVTPPRSSPQLMNWSTPRPGNYVSQQTWSKPGSYLVTVSNTSKTSSKTLIYSCAASPTDDGAQKCPFGSTVDVDFVSLIDQTISTENRVDENWMIVPKASSN
mmetsp:Transcript_4086/g.5364  ORF Transcript_4086/g.5364 Transcript_4086/m.5364 type:complete len:424 (+) Transcript_4086:88-1359(+)